jgi:hypothetical protein
MSGFRSSALQAKNGFVSVGTVSSELGQRNNSKTNVKNLNDLMEDSLNESEPTALPPPRIQNPRAESRDRKFNFSLVEKLRPERWRL